MKIIINGNETWVYGYDSGTKFHLSNGSIGVHHDSKKHVDLFFYALGIVHLECAPESQIINKEYFLEFLPRQHNVDLLNHNNLEIRCLHNY